MKHKIRIFNIMMIIVLLVTVQGPKAQWVQPGGSVGGRIQALCVNGSNSFAGTQDSGVYLSTSNGTNWTAFNIGLKGLFVKSFAICNNYIFAGEYDGVWRRPLLNFTGTIGNPSRRMTNNNNFRISLSAALGSKPTIAFSLSRRERVSFTVYNITGKAVQALADKHFESGLHTLFLNTKYLAPGSYMVKMQTANNTCTKTISLVW